jgi:hypothetical protein
LKSCIEKAERDERPTVPVSRSRGARHVTSPGGRQPSASTVRPLLLFVSDKSTLHMHVYIHGLEMKWGFAVCQLHDRYLGVSETGMTGTVYMRNGTEMY